MRWDGMKWDVHFKSLMRNGVKQFDMWSTKSIKCLESHTKQEKTLIQTCHISLATKVALEWTYIDLPIYSFNWCSIECAQCTEK